VANNLLRKTKRGSRGTSARTFPTGHLPESGFSRFFVVASGVEDVLVLVGVSLFFGRSLADELMFSTLSHQRGVGTLTNTALCVMVFGILTESSMLVHEYCHSWPDAVKGALDAPTGFPRF